MTRTSARSPEHAAHVELRQFWPSVSLGFKGSPPDARVTPGLKSAVTVGRAKLDHGCITLSTIRIWTACRSLRFGIQNYQCFFSIEAEQIQSVVENCCC